MIRLRHNIALMALVAACFSLAHAQSRSNEYNLPDFGEPADQSLPLFEERQLGAEVYRELLRRNLIHDDPELSAYLNALGLGLVEFSEADRAQRFRFFVIRDPSINAFALPGGYIGVHTGLLKAAENEAELAAVLAHEIAHVTQRHIARQINETKGWDLASAALLLAALVAGGSDPDLVQAALGIGMTLSYQQKVNFTRAHELEADRIGIRTLSRAGFSPSGMENFFRRLAAQSRLYGDGIPELLRTHPVGTTRMAEARNRIGSLPPGADEITRIFALMQVRAELAELELSAEKLDRYQKDSQDLASQYGRAQALRAKGKYPQAVDAARKALADRNDDSQVPTLTLELARALSADKKPTEATQLLASLHKKEPANHAATVALAQLQLDQGDSAAVRQLLIESDAYAAGVSEVFRILAQAAGQQDDQAEAQYQLANWQLARGNWPGAIRQLQQALRQGEFNEFNTARLQGRLDSLVATAPKSVREEMQRDRQDRFPREGS